VDVEVAYDREVEPQIVKQNFGWDRVDPVDPCIGRIGVNDPEGVENGDKKRLAGGDIKGEDVGYPFKLGEHRVVGKKRHMDVGSHTWLPNRGKKGLEPTKERKVRLVDRWILQKDYRGVGGRLSE